MRTLFLLHLAGFLVLLFAMRPAGAGSYGAPQRDGDVGYGYEGRVCKRNPFWILVSMQKLHCRVPLSDGRMTSLAEASLPTLTRGRRPLGMMPVMPIPITAPITVTTLVDQPYFVIKARVFFK